MADWELLERTLELGDDDELREQLTGGSGLPGARLNLGLVDAFADAVGRIVAQNRRKARLRHWPGAN
jgi:hypothetical protein